LTSGASTIRVTLSDGRPRVSGAVEVPIDYAGEPLTLVASVDGDSVGVGDGAVLIDDVSAIPLRGALVSGSTGSNLVTFEGTVGELRLAGAVPTALLAAPLPEQARPDGELLLDGTIDL